MKIWPLPKYKTLTTNKNYCGKEEKLLLLRSNFSSFPQYFQYISNLKSPFTYIFVKCGFTNYFFLNSANLICRSTDISKYFRESHGIGDSESRLYLDTAMPYHTCHKWYMKIEVQWKLLGGVMGVAFFSLFLMKRLLQTKSAIFGFVLHVKRLQNLKY